MADVKNVLSLLGGSGVRKTRVEVTISEQDASLDIASGLLDFSYTDKETDEAEDVSITLKDERGLWAGAWAPDMNATLVCTIVLEDTSGKQLGRLPCGKFHVDSRRIAGSPRVFEMRATSIPPDMPMRRKKKERVWKQTSFKDIASTLASENNLQLFWDCGDGVGTETQEQIDQKKESDLAFLSRLAKDNGVSIKVSDGKLVLFDQAAYEKKSPIATIVYGVSPVLSYSFSQELNAAYKSCTVTWRDPKKKVAGEAASRKPQEA